MSRKRRRSRRERRDAPLASSPRVRLSDPYLASVFGVRDGPGAVVSPDGAQSSLAVAFRCITLISEALATVPLHLFRRLDDGGRERASNVRLYDVLHDGPNPRLTAFEGRELLVRSVLEAGNGYALIERDGRGAVVGLHPLAPHTIGVERLRSGRLRYRHSEPAGGTNVYLEEEMLHLRYASRDGLMGVSPLAWARQSVGLAVDQANLADAQVRRGFAPTGVFETEGELSQQQYDRLRSGLSGAFSQALDGSFPLVLEGGTKFSGVSPSAQAADFIAARRLSYGDVARIFGVPLSVLGLSDRPTYGSVEQEHRGLVALCLAPWARRIENAMMRALLTEAGRRTLFIEHDLAGLLRGDLAARYSGYSTGIQWGFLSPNDVRRIENLPPRAGGDDYLRPLNMSPPAGASGGAAP